MCVEERGCARARLYMCVSVCVSTHTLATASSCVASSRANSALCFKASLLACSTSLSRARMRSREAWSSLIAVVYSPWWLGVRLESSVQVLGAGADWRAGRQTDKQTDRRQTDDRQTQDTQKERAPWRQPHAAGPPRFESVERLSAPRSCAGSPRVRAGGPQHPTACSPSRACAAAFDAPLPVARQGSHLG